jgi:hypothetical protein
MSAIYYYKRKTNPIKWLIIILIIAIIAAFLYWFYVNYFSKIEISKPEIQKTSETNETNESSKALLINLSAFSGKAQMAVNDNYSDAIANTILHQGDKIKTASDGRVILNIENGSITRIGENTELILKNTDQKNFLFEQNGGRVYYNFGSGASYQVKAQNVLITASGTKFEVISNIDGGAVTVLTFEGKIKVEVIDESGGFVMGSELDASERAGINLRAAKKDMLKLDNFNIKTLGQQEWYKWNFDLDKGLNPTAQTEPTFEEVKDSLLISANLKENGVYLAWSVYNRDDFKSYQIVRSETNPTPKFPDDPSIKSFGDKDTNSYLDSSIQKDKNYYYRVCVIKLNDNMACGTVANIQTTQVQTKKDSIPPQAPILSATISESGVNLFWSKNQDTDFKAYAILRSTFNFSPSYPADKFTTRQINQENYFDKEVNITSAGAYYYKVCSVDSSDNFNCSNTISVIDGKVQ